MQQMEIGNGLGRDERMRVQTVVETLATAHGEGESVAEVAHDARNMVTALGLYCDLLDEPGVLAPQFRHYGNELRLVATASRRLVEKLIALDARGDEPARTTAAQDGGRGETAQLGRGWDAMPAAPIRNLAREVLASRNLLAALAGPAIVLTVDAEGGAVPVRLNGEDLTRVLVNLVRNAAEAMPAGGRIRIAVREQADAETRHAAIRIEDNGPGIPADALETVFASGYTTRTATAGGPGTHRGLGLAISRSIMESAGGRIGAIARLGGGACIELVLPVGK